jgi:hypothetical protein
MATKMETKQVNVNGDMIEIHWDGNMWVSPSNGRQHARAADAMRAELEKYFRDCGEDIEDEDVSEQIDGYLSQMVDAAPPRRRITISGNWEPNGPERLYAGSGTVDQYGAIECSADIDLDVYEQIEAQIADGDDEGSVTVHSDEQDRDITYHWSIDE